MVNTKNGCGAETIDNESVIRKSEMTTTGNKLTLQQRTFLTVPYLGRGNVESSLENEIRFGETLREKKSVVKMMEAPMINLENFPLYDTNAVIHRGNTEKYWQSGISTRDIYKKNDYQNDKK
jgi:hypothetical protein